jgi:hypothetical protein
MVSWFGSQNQAGYGLSIAPQNRWEDENDVGHAPRSSGLLRVEASQARVWPQEWWRHGADGARGIIVEVASRSS